MPRYQVYYLRDDLSRRFRELPPASVKKQVKQREYEAVGEMEAANPYAAWKALQSPDSPDAPLAIERPFAVGDVLEQDDGKLQLCLFGGFEEASWWAPPPEQGPEEPQSIEVGDQGSGAQEQMPSEPK